MHVTLLVLRLVIGLLFVGHGTQKLFGYFGGHGLQGTAGFFESLGLRPGIRHARGAGLAEALGGALLAFGLVTPLAAALLIAVMTAAVVTVHFQKGLWNTEGGYEYNLVLAAAVFAIVGTGPGNISLDHVLGIHLAGLGWAVIALAAGIAGALANIAMGRAWSPRPGRTGHAHPFPG